MLPSLCRKIRTIDNKILRFYAVNFQHASGHDDKHDDNNEVFSQDFNISRVRRESDKSLRLAILGLPNAGKSTLINQLAERQICAMSGKAHTTRTKAQIIYSNDDTQIIFIDTPGLVTNRDLKKFKLEPTFKTDIDESLKRADLVAVVQDAAHPFKSSTIDERVIETLKRTENNVPAILVLNKIDRVKKKRRLLELVDKLTSEENWPNFTDVFMISALENDGIEDLRNYLLESAKPRDWDYSSEAISDVAPAEIVERAVKSKFMDSLPNELPYVIKTKTEYFGVLSDDSISAVVTVDCPTDRVSKLIMGPKGTRIKQVAIAAEQELSNAFRTTVRLKIAINFHQQVKKK